MTDQSVKCRACTRCCRAPTLSTTNCHAPFTPEELDAMRHSAPHLRSAVIEHCDEGTPVTLGQPCQFLDTDTGRCLIYEDRPGQCRGFVVDGAACVEAIASLEGV